MKWILLSVAGFSMLSARTTAQHPDSAQIAVRYRFSYIRDTASRDKPPNEKRLVRRDWIPMAHFIITDALPVIDWRITSDTASFGGLHCQKATTHVPGRGPVINNPIELPEKK